MCQVWFYIIICTPIWQNVAVMKAEMERLWDQNIPVVIEVKGQNVSSCEASPPDSLLLEQWTLQVVPKK